ncbi:hypothetical protein FACS1894172_20280 [Spirochaetia bacterium]|nr:hypothetical protein FACS1894172_20280 [Spirochaetia bacterium]
MQTVKTDELGSIIALPSDFRHKKVEVIIQLIPTINNDVFESESFGMWEDRQDMNNAETYIENLRKGRKLC